MADDDNFSGDLLEDDEESAVDVDLDEEEEDEDGEEDSFGSDE